MTETTQGGKFCFGPQVQRAPNKNRMLHCYGFLGKIEHPNGQNVWRMRVFTELTHILQRQTPSMHVWSTMPHFPQA